MFLIDRIIIRAGKDLALAIILFLIEIEASKDIIISLAYFRNFKEFKWPSFKFSDFLMFMVVDFKEFRVILEVGEVIGCKAY